MNQTKLREEELCPVCGGDGQEIVGENRVSLDMAIDAGDRSMEGMFHSYAYGACSNCGGSGVVDKILNLLEEEK